MAPDEPTDLDRWATETRDDATIAERARVASLRRQLAQDATFGGVLVDLVEQRLPLVLGVVGGTEAAPLAGVVEALGRDHLRLRHQDRGLALVALAHVTWVRGAPGRPAVAAGDRASVAPGPLVAVLHGLAEERAPARLRTADGTDLRGTLVGVGSDVVVLDQDVHGRTFVPLGAVAVVRLYGG